MYSILNFLLLRQVQSYCDQFGRCESCTETTCTSCYTTYGVDKRSNSPTKGQCIPCQSFECTYCSEDAQICTGCRQENTRDGDANSITYGKCTKPCPDFNCKVCQGSKCISCYYGYGVDENGICKKCNDPNCIKCENNYKICQECDEDCGKGVDLDSLSKTYGQCILPKAQNCEKADYLDASLCKSCKKGYYFNNNKECIKCPIEHCSSCQSQTDCQDCEENYYLLENQCQKCPDNCSTCDDRNCYSCINGFYLNNFYQCIDTGIQNCNKTSYDNDNTCVSCNINYGYDSELNQCIRCKDPNCISCYDDYNKCYECNDGFFVENQSICVKTCFNEHCQECYPYDNNHCKKCDDGYGGTKCMKCTDENCVKCGVASLCDQCSPDYCLSNTGLVCVPSKIENCEICHTYGSNEQYCVKCLSGHYYNDFTKKCEKCQNDCEICYGSSGICKTCKDDKMPDFSKGSSSYGMCSRDATNNDLNNGADDDGDLPEWVIIVIIVVCCVVVIVIISVIIYCICKKKKINAISESP